jgi:hypothetical protein
MAAAESTPTAKAGVVKRLITLPLLVLWRAFFWTYDRATWQYDLMVIAILAFVWLTPPSLLGDPAAQGDGLIGWILEKLK